MLTLIILFSVVFATISIGAQIFISKKCDNSDDIPDSSKIKAGAIILLVLNAYTLIKTVINLTIRYPANYTMYDVEEELGLMFVYSFSILIIISYIAFSIFLLMKSKTLAVLSSVFIIFITLFNAIIVRTTTILSSYISLLPTLLVLSSFAIIFAPIRIGYQKIIKATPYLLLLDIINTIIHIINAGFSFDIVISILTIILEVAAFILIFNFIEPSLESNENAENKMITLSQKQGLLLIFAILIFPLIIALISSIGKVWLFVSFILLAVAVPFVVLYTQGLNIKTRIAAVAIILAIVIGLCLIVRFVPDSDSGGDKCVSCGGVGMVNDGFLDFKTCPTCRGTGLPPN
ncbi:MAG: hypothetical protein IJD79_08230 [Clostridia bacterium]|nr:hypothetical protein [Clostridia bacterium]